MPIADTLKRWFSYVSPRPVSRGFGVSTDDSIILDHMPSQEEIEEPRIKSRALYRLRENFGRFELVGFVGAGIAVKVQFRHVLTGETFNVSKKMADLLFEKDPSNEKTDSRTRR